MNRKIQIFSLLFLGISSVAFAQIKEEKLILDRKREPEVRKIEKKQTSVAIDKNYPPKEKRVQDSLNLKYDITDVPAVSDFKTSTIQGSDISPKFEDNYQKNYIRLGGGNYSKFLADANVSGILENKMEVGTDLHYLSTAGLKKEYPWSSKQMNAQVGAYLNHYGEKGKANVTADLDYNDYNYYGIYTLSPAADADLKQKTTKFSVNGYYDNYSDEILDDIRVKTSFLGDHFKAREANGEIALNLAKNDVSLPGNFDITMNAGLGLGLQTQNTTFDILNKNSANFLKLSAVPKLAFYKGKSYLNFGVDISYLNSKNNGQQYVEQLKESKTYFFPKVELLVAATDQFNFYAGVDGGIQINSYSDLLAKNPYLVSDQLLKPTITKYKFYVGMKGDIDQNLKYDFSGGYGKVENAAFYVHNALFEDVFTLNRKAYDYANTFSTVYDNGTLSTVHGSLQYFPLENLSLKGALDYSHYNLDALENAYYINRVQAEITAQYTMLNKKLLLGFTGLFGSGNDIFAYNISTNSSNTNFLFSKDKVTVKRYADLNLSAEYKIHKNFSIFALGNNILNTKYQNYYGYKVLGAQILGGVKISF